MPLDWDAQTFADHYDIGIRWAGPSDPAAPDYDAGNVNGERIGERVGFGIDFARYAQRSLGPFSYYLARAEVLDKAIRSIAGTTKNNSLILVGAEMGYTINSLRNVSRLKDVSSGYSSVWGIDLSAHIKTKYDAVSERIGDEDVIFADWLENNTKAVQDTLDGMAGFHSFDIVLNGVTESYDLNNLEPDRVVFESHLDANEVGLSGVDSRLIINMIDTALQSSEDGTEGYYETHRTHNTTLMSLADWAVQRSSQSWLDMRTGEFVVGR